MTHQGDFPATDVRVEDNVPSGLTYVPGSELPLGSFDGTTWLVGNMDVGDSRTLTFETTVTAPGVYVNQAEISFMEEDDSDSTPDNDSPTEDDISDACISVPYKFCEGEFSLTATAPSGYVMYQWYRDGVLINNQTSEAFEITIPGEYYYEAYLSADLMFTSCCPIKVVADSPTCEITKTKEIDGCDVTSTGEALVTSVDGVEPHSYLWTHLPTGDTHTGNSLLDAVAGIYDVVVTDADGCTSSCSVEFFPPMSCCEIIATAQINKQAAECFGPASGEAEVTFVNHNGDISEVDILWSNGETTAVIMDLTAGTYEVTVTDVLGCTATDEVIIEYFTEPTVECNALVHPDCSFSNGEISLTIEEGRAPYDIMWAEGQTTSTISGLSPGTYAVTITDANGCTANCQVKLDRSTDCDDLALIKTTPQVFPVIIGQVVQFDIYVENQGFTTFDFIELKDLFPIGYTFDPAQNTNGWLLTGAGEAKITLSVVNGRLPSPGLQPGENMTIPINLTITPLANENTLTNYAFISSQRDEYLDIDDVDSTPGSNNPTEQGVDPGDSADNDLTSTDKGGEEDDHDPATVPFLTLDKAHYSTIMTSLNCYDVTYLITVDSRGGADGIYNLNDEPFFDSDFMINGVEYTTDAPGNAGNPGPATVLNSPYVLATSQDISHPNAGTTDLTTHEYYITYDVCLDLEDGSVGNDIYEPSDCGSVTPNEGSSRFQGLHNEANLDVNLDGNKDLTEDACDDVPYFIMDKTFVGFTMNADRSYHIVYSIVVSNIGGAPGDYDLYDLPQFDTDFTISNPTYSSDVPHAATPLSPTVPTLGWLLGSDIVLNHGNSHTYTLEMDVAIDLHDGVVGDDDYTPCGEGGVLPGSPGEALYNEALLDVNDDEVPDIIDEECGDVPIIEFEKIFGSLIPTTSNCYEVMYYILVDNEGGAAGYYDLIDQPYFDDDITIHGVSYMTTAIPHVYQNPIVGVEPYKMAENQVINPETQQIYTILYDICIDLDDQTVGDDIYQMSDCSLVTPNEGSSRNQGLHNEAAIDLNDDGTYDLVDDACEDLPYLLLDKTHVSTVETAINCYDVTYEITVENIGGANGLYNLNDVPYFDNDITINSVAYSSDAPGNPSNPGPIPVNGTPYELAGDQVIAYPTSGNPTLHTYVIVYNVCIDLSDGIVGNDTYENSPCENTTTNENGSQLSGLHNEANLDVNTDGIDDITDDACDDLPFITLDKTLDGVSIQPDGSYNVTYSIQVCNTGGAQGEYDLYDLPQFDDDLIINTSSYTSLIDGINGGSALTLPVPATGWFLNDDQTIQGGTCHDYRIVVNVDLELEDGQGDDVYTKCGNTGFDPGKEGEGLFNEALVDLDDDGNPDLIDEVCEDLPVISMDKSFSSLTPISLNCYKVDYVIEVENVTSEDGQYDLFDQPFFDDDITISAVSYSTDAPGHVQQNLVLGNVPYQMAEDQIIVSAAVHTYTISFDICLDLEDASGNDTYEPSDCGSTTSNEGSSPLQGLHNEAYLDTNNDGTYEEEDDACEDIPYLTLDKSHVTTTETSLNCYDVVYRVTVENIGGTPGEYDLIDVPNFDTDFTINIASFTSTASGNPGGGLSSTSSSWTLATDQFILDGMSDVYDITVNVCLDLEDGNVGSDVYEAACGTATGTDVSTPGEGLHNTAELDANNDGTFDLVDDACDDVPYFLLDKEQLSITPQGDGSYNIEYKITVENIGAGAGQYDLYDLPLFEDDIFINSASYTSDIGLANPALPTSVPTLGWLLANDQAIPAYDADMFFLTINVTMDLMDGVVGDDVYVPCGESGTTPGAPGEGLYNRANLDTNNDGTIDLTDDTCEDLEIVDVALIKTNSFDGPYNYGQTITFQIKVVNQGTVPLANIEITDYLPCGFTFINGSNPGWTNDANGLRYTITSVMQPGDMIDVPLNVTLVSCVDPSGDQWTNAAEVSQIQSPNGDDLSNDDIDSTPDNDPNNDGGGIPDGNSDNELDGDGTGPVGSDDPLTDEDDEDPERLQIFDLALNKTASNNGPFNYNDNVSFDILVINQGNTPADNIVIIDYAPSCFTLNDPSWTLSAGMITRTLSVANGGLPSPLMPGQSTSVSINFTIGNCTPAAQVNYAEIAEATDGNGDPVIDVDSNPDTTNGNDPGGQPESPADDYLDGNGTGVPGGSNPDLDEDDHDPEQILVNPGFDLALTKVLSQGQSSTVVNGATVDFDIEVFNQGSGMADNIEITDYLPSCLTLADTDWTDNGNGTASITLSVANNGLNAPLAPNTSVIVELTVLVDNCASGSITNWAEISDVTDENGDPVDDIDSDPDNDPDNDNYGQDNQTDDDGTFDEDDHDPAEITVAKFDLALVKVIAPNQNQVFQNGDNVDFDITVYNQGDTPADNIEITDYIPACMSLNDNDWTDNNDGTATILLSVANGDFPFALQPNNSITTTITLTLNNCNDGTIVNYSEISGATDEDGNVVDDIDSTPDNTNGNDPGGMPDTPADDYVDGDGTGAPGDNDPNTDEDDHDPASIVVMEQYWDLALIKTMSTTQQYPINVNDPVTFTIEVLNQGPEPADNIQVIDYMPPCLSLFDNDWADNGNGTATIMLSTANNGLNAPLAQGQSVTVDITLMVDPCATATETNWAEIASFTDENGDAQDDVDSTPDTDQSNDAFSVDDFFDGRGDEDEDDHDPEDIIINVTSFNYDLALIKTLSPGQSSSVSDGMTVSFDITIFNQGTISADNIEITDYIPSCFLLNDPSWTDNGNSTATKTLSVLNGGLNAPLTTGQQVTTTILLTVNGCPPGTITNWGEISSSTDDDGNVVGDQDSTPDNDPDNDNYGDNDQTDGNGTDDEDDHDPAEVVVVDDDPVFDLALIKQLEAGQSRNVVNGATVTFNITVFNQGTGAADNIEITDYLPSCFDLFDANWTDNGNGTASIMLSVANNTLTMPLAPNDFVSVPLTVLVNDCTLGSIVNWAEISDATDENGDPVDDIDSDPDNDQTNDVFGNDDQTDGDGTDDEDDHDPEEIIVNAFDLALIKQLSPLQDATFQNGDLVHFDITVFNQGDTPADNIEITDYIPSCMSLNDTDWLNNNDGTASITLSVANGGLSGPLMPGLSVMVEITLMLDDCSEGVEINWAEISDATDDNGDPVMDVDSDPDDNPTNDEFGDDDQTDGDGNDDEDDHDPAEIPITEFDLALIKQLTTGQNGPFQNGDLVTFDIKIINQGSISADNIEVIDYMPSCMVLSDADWTNNGNGTASIELSVLNNDLAGPLLPGDEIIVPITLQLDNCSAGNITNWAEISDATDDMGDPVDDIDSDPDIDQGNDNFGSDDQTNGDGNNDEDDHDPETIEVEDPCVKPVLTIGNPQCLGSTYSVIFYHSIGATVTADAGLVGNGIITQIPLGTDVTVTASLGTDCETVEVFNGPDTCPLGCQFPQLNAGQPLCDGTSFYDVSFTWDELGDLSVNAGSISGNTIQDIPVGTDLMITATNGNCITDILVLAPEDCDIPCVNPDISISGPICAEDGTPTYKINYTASFGAIVTSDVGVVGSSSITNIPSGYTAKVTVSKFGCEDKVVLVPPAECGLCIKPTLTAGIEDCDADGYRVLFYASAGANVVVNQGTINGFYIEDLAFGSTLNIKASTGITCFTELEIPIPDDCPIDCEYPHLTTGQPLCIDGSSYEISFTWDGLGSLSANVGTITGDKITNIPTGTDLVVTATVGDCESVVEVTSPLDCDVPCVNPDISVSGPICHEDGSPFYKVNYIHTPGSTVSSDIGIINNGEIHSIPSGESITITLSQDDCPQRVIVVPAANCIECIYPVLTAGNIECEGNFYEVTFYSSLGSTVTASVGNLSGFKVTDIPIGNDLVLTGYLMDGCLIDLLVESPNVCDPDCEYPELTMGQEMCQGSGFYSVSYTWDGVGVLNASAGQLMSNSILNIPIGTDVTLSASVGNCIIEVSTTSPEDCSDPCEFPNISLSGPLCESDGMTYFVQFISTPGTVVTSDYGIVGNEIITDIPSGQNVTVTASTAGCDDEIVIVPFPECQPCEYPELTLGNPVCGDDTYSITYYTSLGTMVSSNLGNLGVFEITDIPMGMDVVVTASTDGACFTELTVESPDPCLDVCVQPELTVGQPICQGNSYEVSFTWDGLGNMSINAGTIIGNTITNIPVGQDLIATVVNGPCITEVSVVSPVSCDVPCQYPDISVSGPLCDDGTYYVHFTVNPGVTVTADYGIVGDGVITGIPAGHNVSITAEIPGCDNETIIVPGRDCEKCERPTITANLEACSPTGYTVSFYASQGAIVSSNQGTISGNLIYGLDFGTTLKITAFESQGCLAELEVLIPTGCFDCVMPDLSLGQPICLGTNEYEVSFMWDGVGSLSANIGTIVGDKIANIPLGSDVTLTASNGECETDVVALSPESCDDPCDYPMISVSGPLCESMTTYKLNYILTPGASVTSDVGVVVPGMITNIPQGQTVTITATYLGCEDKIIITPKKDCSGTFDLALTKVVSSAGPHTYGDDVVFDINVFNQGTINAANVEVTDYVPAGYIFNAVDNPGWTLNVDGTVSYTIPTVIPALTSTTIGLTLELQAASNVEDWINYAEISDATDEDGNPVTDVDSTPDNDPDNDNDVVPGDENDNVITEDPDNPGEDDEDDHDPAMPEIFDLALNKTKTDNGPFEYGDIVTFNINVYNQGNVSANNIVVNDFIPCGLEYLPANDGVWSFDNISSVAQTTITNILDPGQSVTIPIYLRVQGCAADAVTAYTNIGEIEDATDEDGDPVVDADSDPDDDPTNDGDPDDNEIDGNPDDPSNPDEDDHDPEVIEVICIKPVLTIGNPECFGNTYSVIFYHSLGATISSDIGSIGQGVITNIPIGMDVTVTASLSPDCQTVEVFDGPDQCPTDCEFPQLNVGQPLCDGTNFYEVSFTWDGLGNFSINAGNVSGNTVKNIPIGTDLIIVADNGDCTTDILVHAPEDCDEPCVNPDISISGPICAADGSPTFSINYTATPGATVTSDVGVVTGSSITGIPSGYTATVTVSKDDCEDKVVLVPPAECGLCIKPTLTAGIEDCNDGTYRVLFYASAGATVTVNQGTVNGFYIENLTFGSVLNIQASTGVNCSTELEVPIPSDCPSDCEYPHLTTGQPICIDGASYEVSFTWDGVGSLSANAGTISGDMITNISVNTDLVVTVENGDCITTVEVTAPLGCDTPCVNPDISVSGPICHEDGSPFYKVNYIHSAGSTVSSDYGVVNNGEIHSIPSGQNVTITLSQDDCPNRMIVVPAANCIECIYPVLTAGNIECDGNFYEVTFYHSVGSTVTASAGNLSGFKVTDIPVGTDLVLTGELVDGCLIDLLVESPDFCDPTCEYPELTMGQEMCQGNSFYSVSYTWDGVGTLSTSAGQLTSNSIVNIPLGTNVSLTATVGNCITEVTSTSPDDCSDPCEFPNISLSGPLCETGGMTYFVQFISSPGTIVTSDFGTVGSDIITNIPSGQNVTITASTAGCDDEIVVVPYPECEICEFPELTLGNPVCNGDSYDITFYTSLGTMVTSSHGNIGQFEITDIPLGQDIVVNATTDAICYTELTIESPDPCSDLCIQPELTVGQPICQGNTYEVSYTWDGIGDMTISAGVIDGNTITGIPVGHHLIASAMNGPCVTELRVVSPLNCNMPCQYPDISVSGPLCNNGTYYVHFTVNPGVTVTSDYGTVGNGIITGIPSGQNVTITADIPGCDNEVIIVPGRECGTCERPTITANLEACSPSGYTVSFYASQGATVTTSQGTISGNYIYGLDFGTTLTLNAFESQGCVAELQVLIPSDCFDCVMPDLSLGQPICLGNNEYEVSFMWDGIGSLSANVGTIVGDIVTNIPLGSNLILTGSNGLCVTDVIATSPESCDNPCEYPMISVSGPICESNTTYKLNYLITAGASVSTNIGVVGPGMITNIPQGQTVTITASYLGCEDKVIVTPKKDCHETFDLALTKVVSSAGPHTYGDNVIFDITVYNQGNINAANVEITDYVPSGYIFNASDNPGWTLNLDGTVSYTIPTAINALTSTTVSLALELQAADHLDDWINYAEISDATDEDGNPVDDVDSDPDNDPDNDNDVRPGDENDDVITEDPDIPGEDDEDDHDPAMPEVFDLALNKTNSDEGPFEYGDIALFNINVYNQGNIPATNIVVNDFIPCGYEYMSSNNMDWSFDPVSRIAQTTITSILDPGMSITIPIYLKIQGCPSDPLNAWVNIAEIEDATDEDGNPQEDADSDPDDDPTNDGDPDDDEIDGDPDDPSNPDEDDHDPEVIEIFDLALQKQLLGDGPFNYGDLLEFTINIFNQGNVDAYDVQVTDYLPAGYTFAQADNPAWTVNGGLLQREIPFVAAGTSTSVTIYLTLVPASGGDDFWNRAEISDADDDGDPNNDDPTDADSDPDTDPDNDNDVEPRDENDDVITEDPDNPNEDDEDDADPAGPRIFDLAQIKQVNFGGSVSYGDVVPYTITVLNQGTVTATNIEITDYLPCGLEYVSENDVLGWSYDAANSVATNAILGPLEPTEFAMLTLYLRVIPCDDDGAWTNYSEISDSEDDEGEPWDDIDSDSDNDPDNDTGGEPGGPHDDSFDGDGTNDEDDHDPAEIPIFDLALIKTVDDIGPYGEGDIVEFEITVFNQGNVDAYDIEVTDYLSNGYAFDTSLNPGWSQSGNLLEITLAGPLTEGQSIVVPLNLTLIVPDEVHANSWYNEAEISDAQDENGDHPTDVDSYPDNDPDNDNPLVDGPDEDDIFNGDENDNVIDENINDPFDEGDDDEDDNDAAEVIVLGGIGDKVWKDLDGDGIQDPNEPPIEGVVVNLTDCNGNILESMTTDSDGNYFFMGLVPGNYQVTFDISNLPEGCGFTFPDQGGDDELDSDVNIDGEGPCINLEPGEIDSTYDAGLLILSSLGDYVWHDLDGDGIQDPGEPGIPDVVVNLYDGDGNLIGTTETDSNGYYLFDDLYPGDYYVEFEAPDGMDLTLPNSGVNDGLDSDVDGSNGPGTTTITHLDPGENDLDWDAGYFFCVPIGELVWYDTNENDVWDSDENGINGITIHLWRRHQGVWSIWETAETGHKPGTPSDDGYYKFCAPPGNYYIEVVMPPYGIVPSQPNRGGDDNIDSDVDHSFGFGTTDDFVVFSGEVKCDIGAGYYPMAQVGDMVWRDENGDGLQDPTEPRVAGVIVQAYNVLGEMMGQDTTGNDGSYMIEYLQKEDYYLKFIPPASFGATEANMGDDSMDSDVDHSNGINTTSFIHLEPGMDVPHVDLGLIPGALPVEWLSFNGENRGAYNQLNWSTASELNSSHFEIERRHETEVDFRMIGKLIAAGTSNEISNYDLRDYDVLQEGIYYYRIKQLDNDGEYGYSKTISVRVDLPSEFSFVMYPNPAINEVTIELNLSEDSKGMVKIWNANGEMIRSSVLSNTLTSGNNMAKVDLTDLLPGIYQVEVELTPINGNNTTQLIRKKLIVLKN